MNNYTDLEIYKMAFRLAMEVHQMTMKLPKYELYEQGSQIRRSSKSIKNNIAEGYGRKRYKQEFIRFLVFAHASCNETISILDMINQIHFAESPLEEMATSYEHLGGKINKFIQYVENNWRT